jgi:hypothetical protein
LRPTFTILSWLKLILAVSYNRRKFFKPDTMDNPRSFDKFMNAVKKVFRKFTKIVILTVLHKASIFYRQLRGRGGGWTLAFIPNDL